ncbi:MAG: fused MFS/spermidine synthase [Vicinamibacterales bacterium]|nr:fused MFS/spermidine synthase [Vicinamibacterales bacterium]
MVVFTLTVFVGSFLLFQIQPLIARYILPWYGGGAAIWTTCMLSFQMLLLGGYCYAHGLAKFVGGPRQPFVHVAMLLAALALIPISPDPAWSPVDSRNAALRITGLLGATIGLPYLVLAASSPLLQHWAGSVSGMSPYRLFAASNAGALVGLLTYPFLLEPLWSLATQAGVWSGGFVLYALLCAACAARVRRTPRALRPPPAIAAAVGPPQARDRLLWVLLSACGVLVLLSTTSQMTTDLAVVPLLWVLPLSLYLATFVICFDHERWYSRRVWTPVYVLSLATVVCLFWRNSAEAPLGFVTQTTIYAGVVFACCMVCHGELALGKPDAHQLTSFYLMVAVGGALGGLLATLVAPLLFVGTWEFPIALIGTRVLLGVSTRWRAGGARRGSLRPLFLTAGLGAAVIYLSDGLGDRRGDLIEATRNFYGALRVYDQDVGTPESVVSRSLYHGAIVHGSQFVRSDLRAQPTTYYGLMSGVGVAIAKYPRRPDDEARGGDPGARGARIGVVGLGAGTIAAHGTPDDIFRFYEIDPDVIRIANEHFFFLSESRSTTETVIGDARTSLERELAESGSQQFDILAIDAFSGDAIPIHLLTLEAVELYWRHLRPDGALVTHISNLHLDLQPVLRGVARVLGKQAVLITNDDDDVQGTFDADWVLMTDNRQLLDAVEPYITPWSARSSRERLWTDDYSTLLGLFR